MITKLGLLKLSVCVAATLTALVPLRADEQVCATCGLDVSVSGDVHHRPISATGQTSASAARDAAQFQDEIYGNAFTLTVAGLPAGDYNLRLGFVETIHTNAGASVFDVTCGARPLATNLDLFAIAGQGKIYRVTAKISHESDALNGPLTLTFTARAGEARLGTFEIRDASNEVAIVSFRADDFMDASDPAFAQIPVVPGPELWRDSTQPVDARVKDLLARLSPAEKAAQMRNSAPAIPRLGLPAYDYWNECLHGVARTGPATVFPQAIGLAAAWDPPLLHDIADAIATEGRAKYNDYTARHDGDSARYYGLTYWTPNINIFRDPRWGRGQETYGEDPFLTARLGVAFIRGLQGDDPTYYKAVACAKHFAVHSGPEAERHTFNASPSERDLYETYLPQFEAAVREARVGAVMGAYNRLYDEPACSSRFLLDETLRRQWGFDGYVVSDCGAITDIYANHQTVPTAEEAAARAVQAGCDLCCGTDYNALVRALKQNRITPAEMDTALGRLFATRIRLGLFDPPGACPFARIGIEQNDTPEHAALALRAAREGIVLLKNTGLLPLDRKKIKRLAVIGGNADSVLMLEGNYHGTPSHPVTILAGIRQLAGPDIEVVAVTNLPLALTNDAGPFTNFSAALAAVKSADVVIYAGGLDADLEREEKSVPMQGFRDGDRTRIELPPPQESLLRALQATGKPVVFVNCSGSAVAMPWEVKHLPAILQAWYPGEEGGRAVAEVLFGDVNPSGRLPVTFYRSTEDLPAFTDYAMSNRTYRYFAGKPQFAFGHGLSYTRFNYSDAQLAENKITANGALKLAFTLENAGQRDGDEVVQVYFRHVNSPVAQPRESLCAFARVSVPAGQAARVNLEIPAERLRYWDPAGRKYIVAPGQYELLVGGASDEAGQKVPFQVE